jgi:nucleotide-binding universal stress UspA family protein
MEIRTIAVALDTSPRAESVLRTGIELARKFGARVVLVRAVGIPIEIPTEAFVAPPNKVPEILERIARTDLEARAAEVPSELLEGIRLAMGVPWEVICRAGKEVNADLIVIGSHGFSGIDRLIGTTASRVVNHADRSVLVVRRV